MNRVAALAGFLFVAFLLSGTVYAQQGVSDDEVNAVAKKLYCPVCENTPLDVCPTQVCRDWREMIRQQLSEGWTEEQVLDYFSATYGPQVLAQPPVSGFNVLVWTLPIVGLVVGGTFLWRLLRRGQKRLPRKEPVSTEEALAPPGISDEMLTRIEREVEARF